MPKLNDQEIQNKIKDLQGWNYTNGQIEKDYELKDFNSALSFVNKIGEQANQMDHHPDMLIHSWNKVKISVSTHSEGGVTEKDFSLANKIEAINK